MITKMEQGKYYRIDDEQRKKAVMSLLDIELASMSEETANNIVQNFTFNKVSTMKEDALQNYYKFATGEDITIIKSEITEEELNELKAKMAAESANVTTEQPTQQV